MARWILLIALVAALVGIKMMTSPIETDDEHVEAAKLPALKPPVGKATLTPGRVVELETAKGKIEFVLFEKDCPNTTKRIVDLATGGSLNGASFFRVEKSLIQTSPVRTSVTPMNVEVLTGLDNVPGAVAMARVPGQYDSNASQFYIAIKSMPKLDQEYTVFGHIIKGMDVVKKIKVDDAIKSVKVRPLTPQDADILKHANLQNPKKPGAKQPDNPLQPQQPDCTPEYNG